MQFLNALAWLVIVLALLRIAIGFISIGSATNFEIQMAEMNGRLDKLFKSIVRWFLGGVVAVLWLVFG